MPNQKVAFINGEVSRQGLRGKNCHNITVDIVCENGLEWVKISSDTEKRVIWDLAKNGLTGSLDDDSNSEDEGSDNGNQNATTVC